MTRGRDGTIKDEGFNDSRVFLAIVGGRPDTPHITRVGHRFQQLALRSEVGAWRWLLTRSMWLYSIPNDSNVACNREADRLNLRFNYFDMISRLTVHLSAMPSPANILYFDELFLVLEEDDNWGLPSQELFRRLLTSREHLGFSSEGDHADLLNDLEPRYDVGRDYLNTVFRKAFLQCGLFQITGVGRSPLGIRLDPATYENPVLAERLRFVLDNPRVYGA